MIYQSNLGKLGKFIILSNYILNIKIGIINSSIILSKILSIINIGGQIGGRGCRFINTIFNILSDSIQELLFDIFNNSNWNFIDYILIYYYIVTLNNINFIY